MNGHGGPRPNSGRKKLKERPTKKFVEEAIHLIDRAQSRAAEVLIEAMEATKIDASGREVPDFLTRTTAAKALLAKRVPDLKQVEMHGQDGGPLAVVIRRYEDKE